MGTRAEGNRLRWCRNVALCLGAALASVAVVAVALSTRPTDAEPAPVLALPRPLQPLIDATPTGASLRLAPGLYAGPAVIARPIVLRGRPGVIIDGGGVGTVLAVEADGVTVSGLTLRNSGDRNDGIDAGLRLGGAHAVIEDLTIEDCLYGIQLQQANHAVVRRNRITSKDLPESRRGDAIRVWYATDNLFEGNEIARVRDGFGIQASGNRIVGNSVRDSRYGAQIFQSEGTELIGNRFDGNAAGVMVVFSEKTVIERNFVRSGRDIAGQGLVFKDSSGARVVGNDLFANAVGIYLDGSPGVAEDVNLFRANRIAFSGTSVVMHSDLAGNVFEANAFLGNHGEVVVRGGGTAQRGVWRANQWDAYEGFDRDGDGVGDTPFEVWAWADRLWMDLPVTQFFRAAPSVALIDLADRLALASRPRLILSDPEPRMRPPAGVAPGPVEPAR